MYKMYNRKNMGCKINFEKFVYIKLIAQINNKQTTRGFHHDLLSFKVKGKCYMFLQ